LRRLCSLWSRYMRKATCTGDTRTRRVPLRLLLACRVAFGSWQPVTRLAHGHGSLDQYRDFNHTGTSSLTISYYLGMATSSYQTLGFARPSGVKTCPAFQRLKRSAPFLRQRPAALRHCTPRLRAPLGMSAAASSLTQRLAHQTTSHLKCS
jgi:hypothetical protein